MLVIENEEYFNKVKDFATKTNRLQQLQSRLDYLGTYSDKETRCTLYPDWAPMSFSFLIERKKGEEFVPWFNGGLIFHGDHDNGGDGGAPTFSVNITPQDGWAVHT